MESPFYLPPARAVTCVLLQCAPAGNPWGSKSSALAFLRGDIYTTESDADLFGFEVYPMDVE